MSEEKRGGRARGQLSAEDPGAAGAAGPTIVGGQPPGDRRSPLRQVPVGLEKVLYTAATDAGFREELLRDRERAVNARGLELQASELAMLRLAPAAQLVAAIDALDTSDTNLARRGFMRAVAGAVTLAAGSVLAGCDDRPTEVAQGIRPGDLRYEGATRGIQPDLPRGADVAAGVRPRDLGIETPAPAGIRPDDLGQPDRKPDGT